MLVENFHREAREASQRGGEEHWTFAKLLLFYKSSEALIVNFKMKHIKPLIPSLFILCSLISNAHSQSILNDAEKYAVQVKASIEYPFAEDEAGTFYGAGFLVDKERGWFLTNAHISGRGIGDIDISFKGQDFHEAELVYVDPELDFSVLFLDKKLIPDFAVEADLDCESTQLGGIDVAAFGHPHGLYYSASRGIVTTVRFYDGYDWVQLDAAINPGNSGGPLINLNSGKIVGINTMSLEDSEGLNFAVPIPPVCKAIQLLSIGKNPSPPKLPIIFASDDVHENYLTVAAIRNGELPVGLIVGDVVIKVEGREVSSPTEVSTVLRGVSGSAEFTIQRGGKEKTIDIKFSPKPLTTERNFIVMDGAIIADDNFLERHEREKYFMFHSVREGSYAESIGFGAGEIIIAVDGVKPMNIEHLKELLEGDEDKQIITRHWSNLDNQVYDYFTVDYSPDYVDLF